MGSGRHHAMERARDTGDADTPIEAGAGSGRALMRRMATRGQSRDVARHGAGLFGDREAEGGSPAGEVGGGLVAFATAHGDGDSGAAEAMSRLEPGAGAPLRDRSRFEAAFGEDFSGVRVHAGKGRALAGMGAEAAARGDDIFLGTDDADDRLMAHELTHVVQQRRAGPALQTSGTVSDPADPAELEAEQVGAAVGAGRPAPEIRAIPRARVQRSIISFAFKMGAKKVSKGILKNFIKTQIKAKLKKVVNKQAVRRFAKEADDILGMLDDPWWLTALGWIPIAGDALDLVQVPRQIRRATQKADKLEARVKRLLSIQKKRATDLLPGTLKRSDSYDEALAEMTYGQIVRLSRSSEKAAKMKKLIENTHRLMDKL